MFRSLNTEEMHILVSFIEFYISSTIVELLGMLFFIVKNVFDKTLKDMFAINNQKNSVDEKFLKSLFDQLKEMFENNSRK